VAPSLQPPVGVSIPRSGFCWFGPPAQIGGRADPRGFNPSVGILLVWTPPTRAWGASAKGFNPSVGILLVWTPPTRAWGASAKGFNPSVGILLVWTRVSYNYLSRLGQVSIPRSGFCWFGQDVRAMHTLIGDSFNPSVGILLVWTNLHIGLPN